MMERLPCLGTGRVALRVLALLVMLASLPGCASVHHMKFWGGSSHANVTAAPAPAPVEKHRDPLEEAEANAQVTPAEPYWPFRVAELELARDSTAAAERALERSLSRDHDYAPALALLTKIQYQSGRNLDAIQRLEEARQRAAAAGRPFPPELAAGLALQYDAIDRLDRASPITATLPADGSADEETAQVFLRLRGEAPDSAVALAEKAVHDEPKRAANQNNYGITRLRAGDPDGAREAFQKAIKLDPTLPGPYYNLAILEKFYLFDDAAAAKWYAAYRARSSDDPDGLAHVFAAPAAGNAAPAAGEETHP
jgi:tetratricopeptide (TPR) repeat protein